MTLRGRLVLWYSGVFFLSAAILVTTMYLLIAHKTRGELEHYLRDEFNECRRMVRQHIDDPEGLAESVTVEVEGREYVALSFELYDVSEDSPILVFAPKWKRKLPPLPRAASLLDERDVSRLRLSEDRHEIVYLMTGGAARRLNPDLVLRVGMSHERIQERLDDMGEYLIYGLCASVVLSVLGGLFLASRSLRPLQDIASSLEHVEARRLSDRLDTEGLPAEIARIASSANRMLAGLEESFKQLNRFAGDAAHELRTPLSALKCRLEVAIAGEESTQSQRKILSDLLEQTNELATLVDNMLLLARLDASESLREPEAVRLDQATEDLAEVYAALAESRGLKFEVSCCAPCTVWGDYALLRRLIANLMENAFAYTPAGGTVCVTTVCEGGKCRIAVADDGIGMSGFDVEHAFERFYRAEESRTRDRGGSGLGLSLCRRIAELHGGEVTLASTRGEGTTATVCLPACACGGE